MTSYVVGGDPEAVAAFAARYALPGPVRIIDTVVRARGARPRPGDLVYAVEEMDRDLQLRGHNIRREWKHTLDLKGLSDEGGTVYEDYEPLAEIPPLNLKKREE